MILTRTGARTKTQAHSFVTKKEDARHCRLFMFPPELSEFGSWVDNGTKYDVGISHCHS